MSERIEAIRNQRTEFTDSRICDLLDHIDKLENSLTLLVYLKDHKDGNGKDSFYIENVDAAWNQAREALNK